MNTDVASLTDRTARLDLAGVDFGAFSARPLDSDTLRCLRYMHDVEHHTICYLRDLLATRAHRDADVTAFLACWSYEEFWHGQALAMVLSCHHEEAGRPRVARFRRQLPARDGLRPLLFGVGSAITRHMVAIHMVWGAVNEWTTQAGYGRLADRSGDPVLSELLHRIMKQEGRHVSFYAAEAQRRLAESRAAQRLARGALTRLWAPVGSGVMPRTEVRFMAAHLFGDADGVEVARRVDRQVDRLPGLSGLHLLERSTATFVPKQHVSGHPLAGSAS